MRISQITSIISFGLLLVLLVDIFINDLPFSARMPEDLLISKKKEEISTIQNIDSLRSIAYTNIENNVASDYGYIDNQEHLGERRFWMILIVVVIEILILIFYRNNRRRLPDV